ncbi:SMP-30/gluconolactonase/LRE family protein [Phormidium sp. CLA17]|uniref:SMP-30/gluconolactonase/LRE family protein n=1 Tax=Leptolyngbya sp. Cla-17 TaxID=2803751 RepID=UPI001491F04F|nr:SMP-30/gluconolactonase/LRE family protein [Leptolyngbya sp. Cla-17]MBM0740990.1 SMP-30/gluconolactonase/LRE family protein [Leptolyngbya sp. Cla-17]
MTDTFGLPPIFAETPLALVDAHQITEFPVNTFLESIVIGPGGALFVTSHLEGKIFRIEAERLPVVHAAIAGKATGLAFTAAGNLLLTAWNDKDVPTVFTISPQGEATVLITMPDAIFLNGLTPLMGDRYLIADSYRGAIWELNTTEKTVRIWLEHPDLARSSSDSEFPAVNGLKIYGDVLYASNTEKMQLVKIPIQLDGQPGEPEIFLQPVNLDDFAFDQDGNLYGTTHIYNSVIKITPDGCMTTIAQAAQGMSGSTALAFGQGDDRTNLYVVTNGGMSLPPSTGLESAKVMRLDIGIAGHPLI